MYLAIDAVGPKPFINCSDTMKPCKMKASNCALFSTVHIVCMTVLPAYYHLVLPMVYFCSVFCSASLHSGFHRHTLSASSYRGFQLTFLCSLCFWLNFVTSIFLSMKSSAMTCSGKWLLTILTHLEHTYVCIPLTQFQHPVSRFLAGMLPSWVGTSVQKKCSYNAVLQVTTIFLVASVYCKLGVLSQATFSPLIPEQTLITSTSTHRTSLITRLPVGS